MSGFANAILTSKTTITSFCRNNLSAAVQGIDGASRDRERPVTGKGHTIYSLRHTAICMRLILSQGQVNIFNLAKNAGTSVDQIERFYARNLPLSREMAINLQSFGGDGEQ
jgi:hypothetical protein